MHKHIFLLKMCKYATLTLLAMIVGLIVRASLHGGSPLKGYLNTNAPQEVPTVHFDQLRVARGFSAPADTNIVFTVPSGYRILRTTLLGGIDIDQTARYWGYCYSGREEANKRLGYIGRKLYDGRFFYSSAELKAEQKPAPTVQDLVDILHAAQKGQIAETTSEINIFDGGETCYLMTSTILPIALDTDGDGLNDKREQDLGTDPNNPDTDHDGIDDGTEVFVTKTSPLSADTDQDGLPDGCEDKNHNGIVDPGETSPLSADTDRDGLCDGDGTAPGCPEQRLVSHGQSALCDVNPNDTRCRQRIPLVHGEDMNQNCKVDPGETDPTNPMTFGYADWQYKYDQLQKALHQ